MVAKMPWFSWLLVWKKEKKNKRKSGTKNKGLRLFFIPGGLSSPKCWYKIRNFWSNLKKIKAHNRVGGSLTVLTCVVVRYVNLMDCTTQEIKFSINGFFSKRDQISSLLRIWSHLLKKPLMENFIFVQCCMSTLTC